MIDKPEIKRLLPAAEVKLAFVIVTAGLASLWAAGHPVEEWSAAAVVLYLAIRIAIAVVVGLISIAAKILAAYGKRVLRRHGVEIPGDTPADGVSLRARALIAALILLTVVLTSAGGGIFASIPAMTWLEITPLSPAFQWAAWALLGCGSAGLLLLLGAPAAVFLAADARIRIRVSEARLAAALSILPEIQAGIPPARNKWI